jgi:hypothetical protein
MIVARMKKYGVVTVNLHVIDLITGSGNRLAG